MSGNSTIADTQPILLSEAIDLVSFTTINGLLYGIALSLYALSARSLYLQLKDPDRRRQATFMFIYSSAVMAFGLVYFALATRVAIIAYLFHNNFVGNPILEQITQLFNDPPGIARDVFNLLVDTMTLAIQIWRLWAVYQATRYATVVIILPSLILLLFIGKSDTSKQYLGIATMLIESYALESVWSLAGLVSNCTVVIEIIAYLLVIYRVAIGRAWSKQTEQRVTRSIQFNVGHSTTLETATRTSHAFTDTDNPLPPAPLTA
ncbi:hypothetical protein P691DRAFT_785804 [Macrolepiota fuliginosa MF-IS2]|uniref:Uncharacterized protein n=1 Tax=Macrolepiota fuliginosa MF-IS2 TaxID=1400762 RepID=A0A9P6BZ60_9AGAR|nr:hypothetical protein P691DRAFT_785804 [Macrolepiota fuliginosa MF-IS2]